MRGNQKKGREGRAKFRKPQSVKKKNSVSRLNRCFTASGEGMNREKKIRKEAFKHVSNCKV